MNNAFWRSAIILVAVFLSTFSWSQKIVFENQMKIYGFDYYIDTVIIAQEEQNFPGHKWVENEAHPFTIDHKSIGEGIQDYFKLSFPYDNQKKTLIIRVNRIIFNSSIDESEIGIHLSFIETVDDEFYHLYTTNFSTDSIRIDEGERFHLECGNHLSKVISTCFEEFLHRENSENRELISRNEMYHPILLSPDNFPILSKNQGEAGYYISFDDFVQNNIVLDSSLTVDVVNEGKKNQSYFVSSQKSPKKYWAAFDGENFFIKNQSTFQKLEFTNDNKILFKVSKNNNDGGFLSEILGLSAALGTGFALRNSTNIIVGSIIGGVAGAIVYFTTEAIVKKSRKPRYYELDLLTGLQYRVPN